MQYLILSFILLTFLAVMFLHCNQFLLVSAITCLTGFRISWVPVCYSLVTSCIIFSSVISSLPSFSQLLHFSLRFFNIGESTLLYLYVLYSLAILIILVNSSFPLVCHTWLAFILQKRNSVVLKIGKNLSTQWIISNIWSQVTDLNKNDRDGLKIVYKMLSENIYKLHIKQN